MLSHQTLETIPHLFQDRLYLESMSDDKHCSIVGSEGFYGRRYIVGLFSVEYYTCDKEPELKPFRGLRFVIWNPVTREDAPPSWHRFPGKSDRTVSALLDIRNTHEYFKQWSDTFKTYYYRFLRQQKYVIAEVTCEEYCSYYERYVKKGVSVIRNTSQARKLSLPSENNKTHFYVLLNQGEVLSGIATVDCFSVKQSYYLSAFTRRDRAPKESGLWLCHQWMKESSSRGILFANFGIVWTRGQPKEWKGFSDFKMKFNPHLLVLQRELVRFTFSIFVKK